MQQNCRIKRKKKMHDDFTTCVHSTVLVTIDPQASRLFTVAYWRTCCGSVRDTALCYYCWIFED